MALQVYIYGEKESGFLDVADNSDLTIEKVENPFDESFSIGEISLPADFPWTENNRRLLQFNERVENRTGVLPWWRCDVYDDGWPEMVNAKFAILTKQGKWNYLSGKFSASISGAQGLFGTSIRGKRLRNLNMGGTITWGNTSTRDFATALMRDGAFPEFNYIKFAPLVIQNFYDKDAKTYADEFLALDQVNAIVDNGTTWTFNRPYPTDPTTPVPELSADYVNYLTVPFFQLKFVIKQIFIENGFNVTGDWINNPEFDDLYIFNNYGVERYYQNDFRDLNREIVPGNHLPDTTIVDFLKATFNFLNLAPYFTDLQNVEIRYRQSALSNKKIFSLNKLVTDTFESTITDQDQNGYTLKYNWDSNDQYQSEWNKDISDKNLVATVATKDQLTNINIARQLTLLDIALVTSENLYYVVADGTATPIVWEVYAEALQDFKSGNGDRSVDLGASTLCQYIEKDVDTELNTRRNMLATGQQGSYKSVKGFNIINDFGVRFFYIKNIPNDLGNIRPTTYNHNVSATNFLRDNHSLAMGTKEGLETLHTAWQGVLNGKETIKTTILVDKKSQSEMEKCNIYELMNVQFLPYKTNKKIPMDGLLEVELWPI